MTSRSNVKRAKRRAAGQGENQPVHRSTFPLPSSVARCRFSTNDLRPRSPCYPIDDHNPGTPLPAWSQWTAPNWRDSPARPPSADPSQIHRVRIHPPGTQFPIRKRSKSCQRIHLCSQSLHHVHGAPGVSNGTIKWMYPGTKRRPCIALPTISPADRLHTIRRFFTGERTDR